MVGNEDAPQRASSGEGGDVDDQVVAAVLSNADTLFGTSYRGLRMLLPYVLPHLKTLLQTPPTGSSKMGAVGRPGGQAGGR